MAGSEKVISNEVDTDRWIKSWDKNDRSTDFHFETVNPLMVKHGPRMIDGRTGIKAFFPLCGKALDMKWFADQGHTVIGVEAAQIAVEEFFEEHNIPFTTQLAPAVDGTLFQSEDKKIQIYCCDFFKFSRELAGQFDAVWDRGSLVAINNADREKYVSLLKSVMAPGCRYLLLSMHYDETKYGGPPHNLDDESVHELFGDSCTVEMIDDNDIHKPWFEENWGIDWLREKVFLITPKY